MKVCSTCKVTQPLKDFPRRAASPDGRHCLCNRCNRTKVAEWRFQNPDRWFLQNRTSRRKVKYGATEQIIERLLDKQYESCAICKLQFLEGQYGLEFDVDHDHATRQLRGLLCHNCNTGLGLFKDNTNVLTAAIAYLNSAPTEEL